MTPVNSVWSVALQVADTHGLYGAADSGQQHNDVGFAISRIDEQLAAHVFSCLEKMEELHDLQAEAPVATPRSDRAPIFY